jgi:outer membrane lipopolysaccharide assembly protein LptE/RlpB
MPSRRQWLRLTLAAAISPGLAACSGWYLRGTRKTALTGLKFYVRPLAEGQLESLFAAELRYAGIEIARKREAADVIVELRNEEFDRRVLSVDPATGKVREIELGLEVQLEVRAANGSLLIAPERFSFYDDFVFDEGSVLGTQEVESTTRVQLERKAARSLALRMEAIDPQRLPKREP